MIHLTPFFKRPHLIIIIRDAIQIMVHFFYIALENIFIIILISYEETHFQSNPKKSILRIPSQTKYFFILSQGYYSLFITAYLARTTICNK